MKRWVGCFLILFIADVIDIANPNPNCEWSGDDWADGPLGRWWCLKLLRWQPSLCVYIYTKLTRPTPTCKSPTPPPTPTQHTHAHTHTQAHTHTSMHILDSSGAKHVENKPARKTSIPGCRCMSAWVYGCLGVGYRGMVRAKANGGFGSWMCVWV